MNKKLGEPLIQSHVAVHWVLRDGLQGKRRNAAHAGLNQRFLGVLVSIAIMLSGCASPARIAQTTNAVYVNHGSPLLRNIQVDQVTGGGRTSRLQMSVIDSKDFRQGLLDSLAASNLLANDSGGKYVLDARIVDVGQPPSGNDITVTSVVQYTLQTPSGAQLLNVRITAPYTIGLNDRQSAAERVNAAKAGSVKSNIAQLIQKLNALKLNNQE